ncbi:unnamed protein product [Lepeophtheirus salmonis]|uniref:(salmon louse) hypothetical protein n=1 Tax=Lepeophtheirus salmonis TaxID=72036 RepID=A0A7R8CPJ0_LEPSM|nr:unnamed protein product [Lepeophtheirus salmonis]CAF2886864.1 unnamed protein product [Lepeophtheirus salmonis]
MSDDIMDQVIEDIKASYVKISLQVDESTDVSKLLSAIGIGPVHNIESHRCVQYDKEFFTIYQLHLDRIGYICTDGASAMLGNRLGVAAMMRKEIPELTITHCFLHRQETRATTLRQEFIQNMEDVDDDNIIKEDLIKLRHNRGIQMEFADGP